MTRSPFPKTLRQQLLDAVHSGRHVTGAQAGNLRRRRRVDLLEIQEHHLPIDRRQLPYERVDPVKGPLTVEPLLFIDRLRQRIESTGLDECRGMGLRSNDARSGDVVSDSVDPCPQRALPLEAGKAYFRIQGPTVIIEYAPQSLGGDVTMHLHSIYRDPTNDYGKKLVGK